MKHIPEQNIPSKQETLQSLHQITNKIGWKHFFLKINKPIKNDDQRLLPTNSKEFHFKGYDFPMLYKTLTDTPTNLIHTFYENNTTRRNNFHLKDLTRYLKANPDIKIVQSDKNLGSVAINTTQYHKQILTHLESDKYKKIADISTLSIFNPAFNITQHHFIQITDLLKNTYPQYSKFLKSYLQNHTFTLPRFHILPKLHKGCPLTTRPIVGSPNWFTTPISKLISDLLKDTIQKHQHIAINTLQVVKSINKFNTSISSNTEYYLVSMDIQSLYTNINLKILYEITNSEYPDITKSIQFICNHNYFEYNEKTYQQIEGIAMGTNAAPELANIYLIHTIDKIIKSNPKIVLYQRYLDDLFLIWKDSKADFETWFTTFQSNKYNLKFTYTISKSKIEYLDLNIMIDENNKLQHSTHQKLLNKYGYIKQTSNHPIHTFKSWIVSELNRYSINSSSFGRYNLTKNSFYNRLLNRNYTPNFLKPIFKNHHYFSTRHKIFSKQPLKKTKDNQINFVIRYNSNKNYRNLIHQISNHLNENHQLQDTTIRRSWQNQKALKDFIMNSRLTKKQSEFLKPANPQSRS